MKATYAVKNTGGTPSPGNNSGDLLPLFIDTATNGLMVTIVGGSGGSGGGTVNIPNPMPVVANSPLSVTAAAPFPVTFTVPLHVVLDAVDDSVNVKVTVTNPLSLTTGSASPYVSATCGGMVFVPLIPQRVGRIGFSVQNTSPDGDITIKGDAGEFGIVIPAGGLYESPVGFRYSGNVGIVGESGLTAIGFEWI